MTRRTHLAILAAITSRLRAQRNTDPGDNRDWVCPMDPDYRSAQPGKCPKCGMTLVFGVPDRVEFEIEVSHQPRVLKSGDLSILNLRILDGRTHQPATRFEIVHEKLIHLFLVSENLEFFAHVHPEQMPDHSFRLPIRLPEGGMYRLLADFYPSGAVPQLALSTIYVEGGCEPPQLSASLSPQTAENLTVTMRMEPERALAGLETRLIMTLGHRVRPNSRRTSSCEIPSPRSSEALARSRAAAVSSVISSSSTGASASEGANGST